MLCAVFGSKPGPNIVAEMCVLEVSKSHPKAYHHTIQNGCVRVCKSSGCTEASALLVKRRR